MTTSITVVLYSVFQGKYHFKLLFILFIDFLKQMVGTYLASICDFQR